MVLVVPARHSASVCAHRRLSAARRLAEESVSRGCRILFLPEVFSFLGRSQQESLAIAEPLDGPLMSRYRDLAARNKLWLSLGGFQETGPDPQHMHNTHVVVDDQGAIRATYRKVHLFDVDVPSGPVLMESRRVGGTRNGDVWVAVASGLLQRTGCPPPAAL